MRLRTDPTSSRSPIYREYFDGISVGSARRILMFFGLGLLLVEGVARVLPEHHWRTPICSLHGVRWLVQEADKAPAPKIVAVGDSALVGGGVHDHDKTFMGQLALAEAGQAHVFNLGVPGGENATSLLLLDALSQKGVTGVSRAIIEILPAKFFVSSPDGQGAQPGSVDELQRFVPFVRPEALGVPVDPLTRSEAVEAALQYDLGTLSAAYRARDILRIEEVGGYPSFWAVGKLLPTRLRTKILEQKGRGTNRLGARMEDSPFDPTDREPGAAPMFAPEPQGAYLRQAIEAAKKLTGRPPVLVEFPYHYEYSILSDADRARTLDTLHLIDGYLERIGSETGAKVLRIDSETFQEPALWTRTVAHPSDAGQLEIWRRLKAPLLEALR